MAPLHALQRTIDIILLRRSTPPRDDPLSVGGDGSRCRGGRGRGGDRPRGDRRRHQKPVIRTPHDRHGGAPSASSTTLRVVPLLRQRRRIRRRPSCADPPLRSGAAKPPGGGPPERRWRRQTGRDLSGRPDPIDRKGHHAETDFARAVAGRDVAVDQGPAAQPVMPPPPACRSAGEGRASAGPWRDRPRWRWRRRSPRCRSRRCP